jgi:hypothetical protein
MLVLRSPEFMNLKRAAAIAVAGAAFAAWLYAAVTPERRGPGLVPTPSPSPALDLNGAQLASEIARLHERLRPEALPRQPARNLFKFRAPAPRPIAPIQPPPASEVVALTRPSRPQPALKLAGIAEDPGPDGPVRTAIISGDGQLFLVKLGEAVTTRYRVTGISPDVVELTDVDDESIRRRLAFK